MISEWKISRSLVLCLLIGISLGLPMQAAAHPADLVSASIKVDADQKFSMLLRFDPLPVTLNEYRQSISDGSISSLANLSDAALSEKLGSAQERLLRQLKIDTGSSSPISMRITSFPTPSQLRASFGARPSLAEALIEGQLPAAASSLRLQFPELLGTVVIIMERPGEEPVSEPVAPGDYSTIFPLRPATTAVATAPPRTHWLASAHRFATLGFLHILPRGLDHILFVAGLFLLSQKLKPLLLQVTAFTAAHTFTLALAVFGSVHVSASIVEPLIAASIAFIAIENILTPELKFWRPAVVFGFGLVHGLGFAGILNEMRLPPHELLPALVSFNLGVEAGQLAVIAILFLLAGWFRQAIWYRSRIAIPASVAIAVIAIVWTFERVFLT